MKKIMAVLSKLSYSGLILAAIGVVMIRYGISPDAVAQIASDAQTEGDNLLATVGALLAILGGAARSR